MGKYMKKAKPKGKQQQLALLDSTTTTYFGVRTRAKTLALRNSQPQPENSRIPGGSYLQLRSRRLHKPPISHDSSKRPRHQNPKPSIPNLRSASRLGLGSVVASDDDAMRTRVEDQLKKEENKGIVHENVDGAGVEEASFGENVLDFEGRERWVFVNFCFYFQNFDSFLVFCWFCIRPVF